jgi:hypothetical protein
MDRLKSFGNSAGRTLSDIRVFSNTIEFPWWLGVAIIIIGIIVLSVKLSMDAKIPTLDNVAKREVWLKAGSNILSIINAANSTTPRQSMDSFLKEGTGGADASALVLKNIHIMTVNATGLLFPLPIVPTYEDGVFTPDAVKYAVMAGARAFVFDIWPSLHPMAGFAPVLQVNEEGSVWRTNSMNAMPLETALEPIITEIYGNNKFIDDFVVFYLRFRTEKRATYDKTATILAKYIDQYRLDMSFNSNNKRNTIPNMPMRDLKGQILVATNVMVDRESPLYEYINYGPMDPTDMMEYLPETMINADAQLIKNSFSFALEKPEKPAAGKNSWDIQGAHNKGINCIAVNVLQANDYISNNFGVYSYKLRNTNLR